jgi:hypothetical protein
MGEHIITYDLHVNVHSKPDVQLLKAIATIKSLQNIALKYALIYHRFKRTDSATGYNKGTCGT